MNQKEDVINFIYIGKSNQGLFISVIFISFEAI